MFVKMLDDNGIKTIGKKRVKSATREFKRGYSINEMKSLVLMKYQKLACSRGEVSKV